MKAKGLEIKEFYFNNWPSDDWYHEAGYGEVYIEDDEGNWLLEDNKSYNLKDIGPLCWQGGGMMKDDWEFEDAFKKWKNPKDGKQYEVIVLKVLLEDKQKLLDFVKENIKNQ